MDWKTWVWYTLVGADRVAGQLLVWAKRRGFEPAEIRLTKDHRFIVVPAKKKRVG